MTECEIEIIETHKRETQMTRYNVEIKATITKIVTVEASSPEEATMLAHDQFSVLCDGDENYDEQTLFCEVAA